MLNKGYYFTTFDLIPSYHYIEVHPEHYKFLGFEWTFEDGYSRHFQFCVLPFSLASACYVFKKVLGLSQNHGGAGKVLRPLFISKTALQRFEVLKSLNPLVKLLQMIFFLLGL